MASNKQILLVRHAESCNNVAKRELLGAMFGLFSARIPTIEHFRHMSYLMTMPLDAELSQVGQQQIIARRQQIAAAALLEKYGVELIVHSPMKRAKETCMGLFEGLHLTIPIEENENIFEKCPTEYLGCTSIYKRIKSFTDWLLQRPEHSIVVVGHSAFFKLMLRSDKMQNVEVRRATLSSAGQWTDLGVVIAGCDAEPHNPLPEASPKPLTEPLDSELRCRSKQGRGCSDSE